ncbi:MAG: hypothetical protein M1818_004483 [Claussenomyces sp. TS43310]|nr:MAG: hypothetical protein M1818_004483 [Claussenomyces sp. TS43310]
MEMTQATQDSNFLSPAAAFDRGPEPRPRRQDPSPGRSRAVSRLSALEGKHGLHIYKAWYFWLGCVVIFVDLSVLPVVYFYAFKFGTSLSMQDIFAIITALFGMFCFIHYTFRCMRLVIIKTSAEKYRPLGWTKWGFLEFFHVNVGITVFLVEVELIVGTIPNYPFVRLCAMVPATIVFHYGFLLISSSILASMKKKLPFNMSSTPKGSPWKPALFAIIEDFGAVEGSGESLYREQLMLRYEESWRFRRMLNVLSWCWGVGLICDGIVATVLIMVCSETVGFGVGWGLPIVVCVAAGLVTYFYVRNALRKEEEGWHKMRCTTLPEGVEEALGGGLEGSLEEALEGSIA